MNDRWANPGTVGTVRRVDHGGGPDRLLRSRLDSDPRRRGRAQVATGIAPAPPGDGTRRPVGRAVPAPPVERRQRRTTDRGVEANARLTGATAAVLFVLFAAEGVTILSIRSLLTPHVFIGMLLVPPVLLKIGTTGWRFARYYLGAPAYRRKGPPPPLLRLLGPLVVVLTLAVLATGIALLLGPVGWHPAMLFLHKATFVLWLMVLGVHVLGHLLDTARLAPRDYYWRTRRQVRGASLRQWVLASSLAVGLLLGALVVPKVGPWLVSGAFGVR